MGVGAVVTVHYSPDQIVANMSVDFDNRISAGEVERIVADIETEVRSKWPQVVRLYVRPAACADDGS